MAYIGTLANPGSTSSSANTKYAVRFQAGSSFTAVKMGWVPNTPANPVKLAIYSDDGGEPDQLLAYTPEIEATAPQDDQIHHANLNTGVTISSGSYYWLTVLLGVASLINRSGSGTCRYNTDTYSDGFSDPFGSTSSVDDTIRVWASSSDFYLLDFTSDLASGGSVMTASDGTNLALLTAYGNDKILLRSDIDGTSVIEDIDVNDVVHANALGGIGKIHAAIDSSDNIHIVSASSSNYGTRDVAYCLATYSAGSWTFGTWEAILAGYAQQAPANSGVAISIDSNDIPHVLYVDNVKVGGSAQDNVYYDNRVGGAWSARTQIGIRAIKTDSYDSPSITLKISDYIEAFYVSMEPTKRDATRRTYTTSWSGETTIPTSFDVTMGRVVAASTAGRWFYADGVDIEDSGVATLYDTNSTYRRVSVVSVLETTAIRYVFYIDTNSDVHLIVYDAGWTDEGALQTGTYEYVIAEWAYNNENQVDEINYIFEAAGTIYYDSFSTAEAGGVPVPITSRRRRIKPMLAM